MKSAGKARNNGLYRHIRTSKEIIRNLLNDFIKSKSIRATESAQDPENGNGSHAAGTIKILMISIVSVYFYGSERRYIYVRCTESGKSRYRRDIQR